MDSHTQSKWTNSKEKLISCKPIGLVLCGGKSERMNCDKALINYHDVPQWQYVHQLLRPICEDVYLSLNAQQASEWNIPSDIKINIDKKAYQNHGPMTALLSAIDLVKGRPLLIVACDYPLLENKHLKQLLEARIVNTEVTCYSVGGTPEPLISIFENTALNNLTSFFATGSDSIFKFIENSNATYIEVDNTSFLKNVNSEEEMKALKKMLDV